MGLKKIIESIKIIQNAIKKLENLSQNINNIAILGLIEMEEELTVGEIKEKLYISSFPVASARISRLAQKKLIKRKYDPEDHRKIKIKLTSKGKQVLEKVKKELEKNN